MIETITSTIHSASPKTSEGLPISHYWVRRRHMGDTTPYDYACLREPPLLDAKLSPRLNDGTPATNYAWHFDAHLVASYLCDIAVRKHGAIHVIDDFVGANRD